DSGTDGLSLVRRVESVAVGRLARTRPRGRPVLHARQSGDRPLARAPRRRRSRLPAEPLELTRSSSWRIDLAGVGVIDCTDPGIGSLALACALIASALPPCIEAPQGIVQISP